MIFIGPIAEELFWRVYVLTQLRKVTYWPMALLIHSFLFAFSHLGLFLPQRLIVFLCGMVLGAWRIRFKSILPLVLAHICFNGVVVVQTLTFDYRLATYVKSNSKCQQMDALAEERIDKAVPTIIGFLGDPDEVVASYAVQTLNSRYHKYVEPYLKVALTSKDTRVLERALLLVDIGGYSGVRQSIRDIVWSNNDLDSQRSAMLSLSLMDDTEGLRRIAKEHGDKQVRKSAEAMLSHMEERKQPMKPGS
jgi:hypothetical protein